MAKTFAADVRKWVQKSERRATAVFQEAAQRVIAEAQTVQGAGGKLPIDTGFLRASGQASLTGWPTGPSRQDEQPGAFDYTLVIAGAKIGSVIYWGWTAEYAPFMEERYGFSRSAAQNWQNIVSDVVREAMSRYP